jgi:hypothetical protein
LVQEAKPPPRPIGMKQLLIFYAHVELGGEREMNEK